MNPTRFDAIAKTLAGRRLSRRRALVQGGASIAAGAAAATWMATGARAQQATPEASADGQDEPILLFLQAFRAGGVTPSADTQGRFTLTLEQGLGHTVYFSDRPYRIVGAMPTPRFLATLGFPDDNPPNAALVVETEAGQTELAVIELFDPAYDEATHTATYEVAVLAEFERDNGFHDTDADLAGLLPQFGAAHLFIDSTVGCGIATLTCWLGDELIGDIGTLGVCSYNFATDTCDPSDFSQAAFAGNQASYTTQCNGRYAACGGNCIAMDTCPL
jgi:hypothetical protein